jgi:hypothetical protein
MLFPLQGIILSLTCSFRTAALAGLLEVADPLREQTQKGLVRDGKGKTWPASRLAV